MVSLLLAFMVLFHEFSLAQTDAGIVNGNVADEYTLLSLDQIFNGEVKI